MNITFIIGNLVKDPEKINGVDLARFTIAVQDNYTKADGTRPVDYFSVVAWNKLGENCLKFLKKGSKVGISGKLQNRQYETQSGEKRSIIEIVANEVEFLSPKKEELEPIGDEDLPF